MKKGLPAVQALGQPSRQLEIAPTDGDDEDQIDATDMDAEGKLGNLNDEHMSVEADLQDAEPNKGSKMKPMPPTQDEYVWMWKVRGYCTTRCTADLWFYFPPPIARA